MVAAALIEGNRTTIVWYHAAAMTVPWSELYACRREIHRRYPRLHRLPAVRRAVRLAEPHVKDGSRILEVGGGCHELIPGSRELHGEVAERRFAGHQGL